MKHKPVNGFRHRKTAHQKSWEIGNISVAIYSKTNFCSVIHQQNWYQMNGLTLRNKLINNLIMKTYFLAGLVWHSYH